jgi:hypothetical protein
MISTVVPKDSPVDDTPHTRPGQGLSTSYPLPVKLKHFKPIYFSSECMTPAIITPKLHPAINPLANALDAG